MENTFTVSHLLKLLLFGVIALISYSPSQGQIYSEGFESDMGGFTISGANPSWIRQTNYKSEGSYAVGTHKNSGRFYDNEFSYLTSPVVSIPETDERILMSFMRREIASWGQDGGYMEISTDNGVSWNKVYSWIEQGYNDGQFWYGNYTGRGFVFTSADISDYRGMDIRFRFVMVTNGSGGNEGLTFDDIQINYLPESYAVPVLSLDSIVQNDLYVSVDFGIDVTGFDNADVTLGNGTLTSITTLSAAKYQLKIRRITPDINIDVGIRRGAGTSVSGSKPSFSVSDSYENRYCANRSEYEYHLHSSQFLKVAGKVYNETGVYIDTLVNSVGCDSIMTTKLFMDLPLNDACDALLQFDGGYEALYNSSIPLTNNSFTLEAWAKADQLGTNRFIFGNNGSTANKAMHFGYNADGSLKMAFYGNDLNGTENVWDNQWHHYAFTFDATTKVRKIYRDGVEMASDISSSNYLSNYLYIGKGYLYGSQQWDGLIDEVKVWNKALSTTEVNASMKLSDDYSESGLIHAYDFNEGTGTIAYDRIGSKNLAFLNMDASNWKNVNGGAVKSSSTQTITFDQVKPKDVNDTDFELDAYSDSFLPITYTSSNESVATISGNVVTIVGAGSTNITASQAGDGCYTAATDVVRVLEVGNQQPQTIIFNLQNSAGKFDSPITLGGSTSSGLPITYVSSNPSVASVLNNILTPRAAGEVVITAFQVGSANFAEATPVSQTLTVTKASQEITFEALAPKVVGDATFDLTATASSGLDVTYTSSNTDVATVSGSTVTIVGAGTTTITASQSGDDNYDPAVSVSQDLVVNKATQTITFEALADRLATESYFYLNASASSGLAVTYTSSDENVAIIDGNMLIIAGGGTASITASQAGNDVYDAALDVSQELIVHKVDQTITFNSLQDKTFGDDDFELKATSSANFDITFTSSNESILSISGNTATIVGAGNVTITASQEGNEVYNAAVSIVQELNIYKATQTISFGSIAAQNLFDGSITLNATSDAGLPVSFESFDESIATINGNVVEFVKAGSVEILAIQAGNANYEGADIGRTLEIYELYIWDGAGWNSGEAPEAGKDVKFVGNYTLSSDMETASSEIVAGVTVTLTSEGTFISNTALVNNGTMVVKSGGQLITSGTVTGSDYRIERKTTFDANTGRYSIVGSPVLAADFDVLGSEAVVYGYDGTELYKPSGNQGLDRFKTPEQLNQMAMQPGRGYFSAFTGDESGLVVFNGTPNTGNVTIGLTFVSQGLAEEADYQGYNLVSNPYPAAISAEAFLTLNSSVIDQTIYIWDDNGSDTGRGTNADYLLVNKTLGATNAPAAGGADKWDGNLRSGQGFFVKTSAANTLSFSNSLKSAAYDNGDGGYFRASSVNRVKLVLANALEARATIVGYLDDATIGNDAAYDAMHMGVGALQVYSLQPESGKKMGIQALPETFEQSVRLGFVASQNGTYTLTLANVDEVSENIILLDKYNGKQINLGAASYSFTTIAGEFADRFEIARKQSVLSANSLAAQVFVFENILYVQLPKGLEQRELTIYNLSGMKMLTAEAVDGTRIDLSALPAGVYLVTAGNESRKIIID